MCKSKCDRHQYQEKASKFFLNLQDKIVVIKKLQSPVELRIIFVAFIWKFFKEHQKEAFGLFFNCKKE